MAIYVTGDTHMPHDIYKINTENFPQQKELNKNDYVIIAGDFGAVWDNSRQDLYWRKWLNKKSFTTLFVDGNHENFDILNSYPVEVWNGGKVHKINDSVYHLMRGQVFTIDNKKIFTMGGASSHDRPKIHGNGWWEQELPNTHEINEALDNLDKNNWSVDYIITHCAPSSLMPFEDYERDIITNFLQRVYEDSSFSGWFCGHYHIDKEVNRSFNILYKRIIEL